MANNFTPSKKLPTDFNSGNKYVNNVDSPSATDFNNVIESQLYTQEFAERLTDTPDITEINNLGTPKVELIQNGIYKKFKFSNLVGKTGKDGLDGQQGLTGKSIRYKGAYVENTKYVNNSEYLDIVYYEPTGCTYCPLKEQVSNTLPTDTTYWGLVASKGASGQGIGNTYVSNIINVNANTQYALQPEQPIPTSPNGTLQCHLVEVATAGNVQNKLDKDFLSFTTKSTLVDSDLIAIQDSADINTPKANKKATMSNIKAYVKQDDTLTANWHAKQETDGTLTFEFI